MANQIFQYDLTIKETHLDFFGHVNNAVYLEILEEARWEFATQNGYGFTRMRETGQGPVVLEVHLKFLKEITLRQQVSVFSQVTDTGGGSKKAETKVGTINQWIQDEAKNRYLEANFIMGFFDLKTRRLVPFTPDWLKAIGVES